MISRLSSRCFLALSICSTLIQLASAGAIIKASEDRDIPTFCVVDPKWAALEVRKADCSATVDMLYDIEVRPRTRQWEDDDFEFHSTKLKGSTGLEQRYTPRKYTVGTCTLAIVMLRFFQDKNVPLPVDEEGYSAYRDVASFYELWEAGDRIRQDCLAGPNMPGMATEGGRDAIGVFLWATNSWQNQLVPNGDPMPPWHPRRRVTLNGTASDIAFHNITRQ